jgi:hypothetical protein
MIKSNLNKALDVSAMKASLPSYFNGLILSINEKDQFLVVFSDHVK